ncbi:hypothetical protein PQR70_08140 [Paraburkholderia madseniana]|uniref:DUF4148 domain-containing protein n=1 Tax=Paraburkholderia madseniana TaxID=2599607 RepID=A0AAP5ESL3_9BURK|nr:MULTISPECIES: hypothetical protein [Paraburkholderia]MCX4144537.1 hypothetical protein [Paraburkholderia madseniana]MDN7147490.1 hypothetical protein [Paraburkholderia sp. WS6]MDQ6406370.1 hypothetical protein [Paraburkholderia madseniana]
MRTFIAALLGATAVLPALVHAISPLPDPADAAASVPAVNVPSAFADYRPYLEQKAPTWQALNRAVASPSGKPEMDHGQMHSGDADANHSSGHGSNAGSNQGSSHSSHGAHQEGPAE